MKKYAYIRVSSKDQNIDRQVLAMEGIGLVKKQMIIDYQTGKDFNRQNYRKLVKKLKD
ncbi:recombinase family protein [Streptococcus pasteurianus]|uniref:Recombinase family protein n=1 Tax=Enterococcus cecorum TaxID=44008 RepID=A0A7X9NPI1_9ENTE|nr:MULTISPECIES: recombinase family protein [Lactobacillales]HAP3402796.1 recombinase family protein [Enterococcus faecalis]MDV7822671.1 recombinase family protein [Enterococcus gallinarum]NME46487.1 recombinase family protein [Enterococcus gallinarum]NME50591.1 recombinase family protein [Enterococcus cecorum]WOO58558.1 recombinase family protein [Streptococcus pasteurianus]